jgi:hypothetical protein
MLIQQWRQNLPPVVLKPTKELMEDDALDNCGPLRLTYLTLELLVFRALLRPLAFQPGTGEQEMSEPRSAIFQNSQSCAKLVLELVAALKANHFVNFWPSCKWCLLLLTLTMENSPAPLDSIDFAKHADCWSLKTHDINCPT